MSTWIIIGCIIVALIVVYKIWERRLMKHVERAARIYVERCHGCSREYAAAKFGVAVAEVEAYEKRGPFFKYCVAQYAAKHFGMPAPRWME